MVKNVLVVVLQLKVVSVGEGLNIFLPKCVVLNVDYSWVAVKIVVRERRLPQVGMLLKHRVVLVLHARLVWCGVDVATEVVVRI